MTGRLIGRCAAPCLAVALVAAMSGCGGKRQSIGQVEGVLSASEVYRQGMDEMEQNHLSKARKLLESIQYTGEERAELEPKVRLAIADATYYQDYVVALIDARALYLDFVTLFGERPEAPYAQFQAGMCALAQIRHESKDQTQTFQAITDLNQVLQRYPTSEFADAAARMIRRAETRLAEHEFMVGRFYMKRKKPLAAAARFRVVLDRYPHYRSKDKLYFYLGQALLKANNEAEARIYLDMLVNDYPDGRYVDEAKKQLDKAGGALDIEFGHAVIPVRAVVLGVGRVGALIARDLAGGDGWRVTAVDVSEAALEQLRAELDVGTERVDLQDPAALRDVVAAADVVVGAVPGALGFAALSTVVDLGKPIVDIAFAPEDPLVLDERARASGSIAVVDCGVAPGLSNWFVGASTAAMDQVDSVEILVGGLPVTRVWPFEYRSVFSPTDVIELYTRPCRLRENGRMRNVPALSGVELVDLPRVGTLEAFYTDGLRTLLATVDAPTLREKTLRYPGHADRMRLLRETGFFDAEPVRVGDVALAPRELTEKLLFEAWELPEGEEEFTVLRVIVEGRTAGRPVRETWHLYDRTDPATGATSMARTTGFPCAIVARMLVDGRWDVGGVAPPDRLGLRADLTEQILGELSRRNVDVRREREE